MSMPASGWPKSCAVDAADERQVHLAVAPGLAELVGRHRHRRERRGGLGLIEAEALGELAGNQVAQRPVVDQHDQLDVRRRRRPASVPIGTSSVITATSASRSMPQAVVAERHVVARAEQVVGAALVHQRIGPERRRHLRAARLAHQLDVVDVGAAIHPVIGARQRRRALRRVEGHDVGSARTVLERRGALGEPRRDGAPSRRAPPAASARCRARAGSA